MKKCVLLVLPSVHAAGTENYVLRLLQFAGNRQYDWHIISLDRNRGDLHEAFEAAGAKIYYQSVGYGEPIKLLRLYKLIKSKKIESISTFTGNFGGLPLAVARLAGVKTRIGWYRATEPAYTPSLAKTGYDKFANKILWANATIVLSNSDAALLRHRPRSRVSTPTLVIDNGVDPRLLETGSITKKEAKEKLGISPKTFTVCHIGRVTPEKNHDTILKTMVELKRRWCNACFIFCGKGTDTDRFSQSLTELGVADMALRLGLRKDLPCIYSASDLFFFPSLTEGQPNALIEAMICGLPLLASNIAPIKEVIPSAQHDLLLDPLDWMSAADRIAAMASGQLDLPKSCRDYAIKRFDPVRTFSAYLKLL